MVIVSELKKVLSEEAEEADSPKRLNVWRHDVNINKDLDLVLDGYVDCSCHEHYYLIHRLQAASPSTTANSFLFCFLTMIRKAEYHCVRLPGEIRSR